MRLIDADKLKCDMVEKVFDGDGEYKVFGYSVSQIKSAPTVLHGNVIPCGQWIDGNPICPLCGMDKFSGLDADIFADWQPPYCPQCGARMGTKLEVSI